MKKAFLSLGSNIGDKKKNLSRAIRYINVGIGHIIDLSGIYETEAWGFKTDETFLNMVIEIITDLHPEQVLDQCLQIEKQLGRVRNESEEYSSRIIDIDVLFYGDQIVSTPHLSLPHPLLHIRRFVLEPLCEIAPDFVHPELGDTIKSLLEKCSDESKVNQLGSISNSL